MRTVRTRPDVERRFADWSHRLLGLVTCAVLVVALLPSTPTWALDREEPVPTPILGEAPVNDVPDSAYEIPDAETEIPDPPPVEPPPAGSPQADALAAIEAETAAELATVEAMFTDDRISGEELANEAMDPDPGLSLAIAESMEASAEDRSAPRDAVTAAPLESGVGSSEERDAADLGGETGVSDQSAAERTPEQPDGSDQLTERDATPSFGEPSPSAVVAAADACAPIPGSPYAGSVSIEQMVTPVWNNRNGSYRVRVQNDGTQSWPLGTSISYQVFDSGGSLVPGTRPSTAVPLSVAANGGWVSFNAAIGSLAPGTWLLAWDIHVPGVGWLTGQGVCSSNFQLVVHNQPPSLTYQAPLSPGTVTTRSPVLTVSGADPDAWPGWALQYQFAVCTDPSLVTGCHRSAWQVSSTWATPRLQWGSVYYWSVIVSDGSRQTNGILQRQAFTVVVPSPTTGGR